MSAAVVLVLLQVVLPLLLLALVASRRHGSAVGWALAVLLAGSWIVAIAAAGVWLMMPWYLPALYGALLLAAMARSLRAAGMRPVWPTGRRAIAATIATGAAAALAAGVAVHALSGRQLPDEAVDLAPPLRGGPFLVANGGSNGLVSSHVMTLADVPRFRQWRGQSYGVDLVRLGPGGMRARGLAPSDPAAYAIYGDTIVAPCAGRVVAATDRLDDLPVPETDRAHMAGNHVLLECGPVWVLLAHMRRGSVMARAGDEVTTGQPLGQVGNTGNTGEPHLHLHAQRPGTEEMPLGGEPVPITIGGRYLVRGERVRW